MTKFVLGTLLLVVLVYGFIEARPLIQGPRITLASPSEGAVIEGGVLTITGTTTRAQSLTLNGGALLIDQKGVFGKTFALPQGSAILVLIATDRFGRTTSVRRTVFVP
jgi:uncharacterized protein YfaP (DUF2135 family)